LGLRRIFHGKARKNPHVSSRKSIQNMKKKVNNQQVNNQQVNGQQVNNGSQHVQLGGMAFYDESKCFLFAPNEHGGGEKVLGFRSQGVAQQLSDGTFDFVVKPRVRSQSVLIRKLAHGRLSKTKDGAIQLTLKVFCDEGINIGNALVKEAEEAADALVEYQLKR
jgi:hypothetical protein